MKAVVLSDNRTIHPEFETEHGLSIYLETENNKFLLDTGASDVFIRNAKRLKVNLEDVDFVFISHGHADHIGGLPYFLEINSKAKIVLSREIVNAQYYSKRMGLRKINIDFDFSKYSERMIYVDDDFRVDNSFYIFKNNSSQYPKPLGNNNLYIKDAEGQLVPDDFKHELIFVAGKEKLFVFTGCAHHGIMNIMDTVFSKFAQPVRCVMGGFHLLDAKDEKQYESNADLKQIANFLNKKFPLCDFITGHCTGEESYIKMKSILEYKLMKFFVGYEITER